MNPTHSFRQRKLAFLFLFISLLIIGTIGIFAMNPALFDSIFTRQSSENPNNDDENKDTPPAIQNLTMIVDFGNNTVDILPNLTMDKSTGTAFDLLNQYYVLEYDAYVNGKLVYSIGGLENNLNENTFWFYWVNNESPNIAASSFILHSNDIILWKYTTSQF